ncbi:MAG: hemin uptake protein HemP [Burkholderiaceae bacterium]|nr:hemin uptake protein HemP [Burkholderiaceae bacterium]
MPERAPRPAGAASNAPTGRTEAQVRVDAPSQSNLPNQPAGPGHRTARAIPATGGPQRRWSSQELLGSRGEAEISHGGAVYRLRLTALGKLILTK